MDIRLATPADREALFDICLRTADAGSDGSAFYSLPTLPGLLYAVPYLDLEPALAFVLADPAGRVLGYTVGTADTARFQDRLDREWLPAVRRDLAGFAPATPGDRAILECVAAVERSPAELLAGYPAHLHINLLPEAQDRGHGRRMIGAELAALAAAGAPAAHLGVTLGNDKALGFYRRLGFAELVRRGRSIYMGRPTSPLEPPA